ncbi:hypothetical protein GN958_ATG22716 [Phytophthora infestans]|uniref:Uncharacterized protein n=1 Tax=Phytophthora infestans TaxID=4787 RepID=A0A8S9TNE7_PHYIN|nr:hypothetical protein GN958_ATG22716 [Phytophthora infestans]
MHPGRASTNVSWLKITDPNVVDFMHGIKDLGPSVTGGGKRMDKTDKLLSVNFATAEADSLHVLVLKVPEYVKESLQEFLEKKTLCNKMESAEGWVVTMRCRLEHCFRCEASLTTSITTRDERWPSFTWSFGLYHSVNPVHFKYKDPVNHALGLVDLLRKRFMGTRMVDLDPRFDFRVGGKLQLDVNTPACRGQPHSQNLQLGMALTLKCAIEGFSVIITARIKDTKNACDRLSAAMHPGRASTNVSWLKITDPDVVDFMHGIKDLGPSVTGGGKRMDKTDKPLSFSFATAEADSLHVIVLKVPEYVKENLQEFPEKKELCNKMEGAEGWFTSRPTNPIQH